MFRHLRAMLLRRHPRLRKAVKPFVKIDPREKPLLRVARQIVERPKTISEKKHVIDILVRSFCDRRTHLFVTRTFLNLRISPRRKLADYPHEVMDHFDTIMEKNSTRLGVLESDIAHAVVELERAMDIIKGLTSRLEALTEHPEETARVRHATANEFAFLFPTLKLMQKHLKRRREKNVGS